MPDYVVIRVALGKVRVGVGRREGLVSSTGGSSSKVLCDLTRSNMFDM